MRQKKLLNTLQTVSGLLRTNRIQIVHLPGRDAGEGVNLLLLEATRKPHHKERRSV